MKFEPQNWAPLHIILLLHSHYTPVRYEPKTTISDKKLSELEGCGLVEHIAPGEAEYSPDGFQTTERGKAYVAAICGLPLPEQKWVCRGDKAEDG